MFDLNTKIILVASSCYKQTGPRKNSIGYIATFNDPLIIDNPNMAIMPATVRFLQYGNEKRDRFETKQVILTFPILNGDQDDRLNKFMHIFRPNNCVEVIDKIHKFVHTFKDTPVVLAAPLHTPNVNFKECSKEEFFCWFESFLMSPQINYFVNKAMSTPCIMSNDITIQTLTTMQKMIVNKDTRLLIISDIYKHIEKREKWINIIRVITITNILYTQRINTARLHKISNNNRNFTDGKGIISNNKIYSILICYIFCKMFYLFRDAFVPKLGNFKKLNETIERLNKKVYEMETTKNMILKLASN